MADILAENLSGKSVMGTDGTELGMLYNITMNLKTGELADIVVEPDADEMPGADPSPAPDPDLPTDDQGRYRVPVGSVRAVRDYIVVER